MAEKRKYKQLPLLGEQNDFYESEALLEGWQEVTMAIKKIFRDNKEYNPRQIEYLLTCEVHLTSTMGLLGLD